MAGHRDENNGDSFWEFEAMTAARSRVAELQADGRETAAELEYERWVHWPINWSAVWTGTMAAIAAVIIFGLIGVALGAHIISAENRLVDLRKMGMGTLIFSVFTAFFAFVIGGWIATRIAGILRAEPAMLHGAITWCLAVPLLFLAAAFGASNYMGAWLGGLAGAPSWAAATAAPYERPELLAADASAEERAQYKTELATYREKIKKWKDETPKATRNSALGAVTALLLGLVGSVIGGWMAAGEPMNFTHYRTRVRVPVRRA